MTADEDELFGHAGHRRREDQLIDDLAFPQNRVTLVDVFRLTANLSGKMDLLNQKQTSADLLLTDHETRLRKIELDAARDAGAKASKVEARVYGLIGTVGALLAAMAIFLLERT